MNPLLNPAKPPTLKAYQDEAVSLVNQAMAGKPEHAKLRLQEIIKEIWNGPTKTKPAPMRLHD